MTAINPLLHTHTIFNHKDNVKDKRQTKRQCMDTFHSITNHPQFIKQAQAPFHFGIHEFERSKNVNANCKNLLNMILLKT